MLAWKVATRFLSASKAQTVLIVLGIAIGVSVQVFVGSLIGSLQAGLIDSTVGSSPHITITPASGEGTIVTWQDDYELVSGMSEVTAVSASVDELVFVVDGDRTNAATVRGVTFSDADGIYGLNDALYVGELPKTPSDVLIGRDLSEWLSSRVGDPITVGMANGTSAQLTISGCFDLKVSSLNLGWLFMDLEAVQELFGLGTGVTSIEIQVSDVFAADAVAAEIEAAISDPSLEVSNWKVENEQLLSGLQGQSISSLMIQVFVLSAVVIAIASILAIKVVQKSREIGILKAMGVKDRAASLMFLFQGLILGVLGAVFGVLLGVMLLYGFVNFATNPDGSSLIELQLDLGFVVGSGVVAVLAATIASLVPARRSSRLSPVEVIRGG